MLRQDYLQRMIQQMARNLARIRTLLSGGEYVEAEAEVERLARQAGVDLRFLISLDEGSLRPMISTAGEIDRPKCALFGELLYLEWRRALAIGRSDRAPRIADRALLVFRLGYEGGAMDAATERKVADLVAGTPSVELSDAGG